MALKYVAERAQQKIRQLYTYPK